ncbi:hypothetical protein AAFN86_06415 [Roseomonas sp. CAU 1739]|uniref:hypothetical protein n=1 Tax=Roseomonas sp. CAU 1739 TaxID=3140364 RepID=UPI00325B383A
MARRSMPASRMRETAIDYIWHWRPRRRIVSAISRSPGWHPHADARRLPDASGGHANMRLSRLLPAAFVAALLIGPAARAQGAGEASGWSFQIGVYAWAPTFNTTLNYALPTGRDAQASVKADADNYLSDLNFAAMIAAEAHYGRFSIITDLMYVDLGSSSSRVDAVNAAVLPSNPISSTVNVSGDSSLQATVWTLGGGYTLASGDWGNVDAIAGFRLLALDARTNYGLSTDITGPRGNGVVMSRNGRLSGSDNIWNGIVGLRGRIRIGDSGFFVPYYADIGTGDSNITWQAFSGIGYQSGWAGVVLGYRAMAFDQGSNDLVNKLTMQGAFLAVTFTF